MATGSVNPRLTPQCEDWEAEFDPAYDANKEEGGVWFGKSDHEIVLLQIQAFNDEEHEERQRKLDEDEADELDD